MPLGTPDSEGAQPESSSELVRLRSLLAERKLQRDQIEAEEKERAKTPLALQLMLVSCSFANVTYRADTTIPEFHFDHHPCPFGKKRPDQDCRDCAHVQIVPYGTHLPAHERRYLRHGMVLPIAGEEQAEHLAHMVKALNLKPLRRVDHEIHALEQAIIQEEERERARVQAENERQQRGGR